MGSKKGSGGGNLMNSYYFYSSILAVQLLGLIPLGHCMCSVEQLKQARLTDLRHLTPFWLLAGLYVTTSPNVDVAMNLMRIFVFARIITSLGYITRIPQCAIDAALAVTFSISIFMGATVLHRYKTAW